MDISLPYSPPYFYVAQAYGTCAYGEGSYQDATCKQHSSEGASSSQQAGGAGNSTPLVNSGFAVAIILVLASAIILTSLAVRYARKRKGRG